MLNPLLQRTIFLTIEYKTMEHIEKIEKHKMCDCGRKTLKYKIAYLNSFNQIALKYHCRFCTSESVFILRDLLMDTIVIYPEEKRIKNKITEKLNLASSEIKITLAKQNRQLFAVFSPID